MVTLAALGRESAGAPALSGACRVRCAGRPVRKSAMSRRWAAISCNVRAAGIFARRRIAACARAAAIASRSVARTNTTPFSTICLCDRPSVDGRDRAGGAGRHDRTHQCRRREAPGSPRGFLCPARARRAARERFAAAGDPDGDPPAETAGEHCAWLISSRARRIRSIGRSPMSPSFSTSARTAHARARRSFLARRRRCRIGQRPPKPCSLGSGSIKTLPRAPLAPR